MSSVLEGPVTGTRSTGPGTAPLARLGHLLAALVNGVLLWVTHQLLDWGWPAFLTSDLELVMGLMTVSLLASIAVSVVLASRPTARLRLMAELVRAGIVLTLALRLLEVFPFDFTGHGIDWSGPVRLGLVLGIAAGITTIVARLLGLLGTPEADELLEVRPGRHA